jgi:hypothetical protein
MMNESTSLARTLFSIVVAAIAALATGTAQADDESERRELAER